MQNNIRKNSIVTCFLMLMLLSLLTGCGGGSTEEVTTQAAETTQAAQTTEARPEVDEDYFYGCWEYADYDTWLCFYVTDVYEWYDTDGFYSDGTIIIEDGVLYLDGEDGLSFEPDGEDGLIDGDGDALFRSELPEFEPSEEADISDSGVDAEDYDYSDAEIYGANAEDFYGTWEDSEEYEWLCIYDNGTYGWFDQEGPAGQGNYYISGDELTLEDIDLSYKLTDGVLYGSNDTTMYMSQLPDYELMAENAAEAAAIEASIAADEAYEQQQARAYEAVESAAEFLGIWEFQSVDEWVVINADGTYGWYDNNGLIGEGYYEVSGGRLYAGGASFEPEFGGLVDQNGVTLFSSMLPNYDGSRTQGSDNFIGCWESVDGGVWLEIYENGEYLYMWDDGYGASGDFAMEGSTLVLQTGTRYTYDSSTDHIKGDDYVMFRSQMPAHLRP